MLAGTQYTERCLLHRMEIKISDIATSLYTITNFLLCTTMTTVEALVTDAPGIHMGSYSATYTEVWNQLMPPERGLTVENYLCRFNLLFLA